MRIQNHVQPYVSWVDHNFNQPGFPRGFKNLANLILKPRILISSILKTWKYKIVERHFAYPNPEIYETVVDF